MSIKTTLAVCAAAASLYAATAAAQTNQAGLAQTNQDQFLLTFRATCVSLNTNRTALVVKTITDRDIVAAAVGTNTTSTNLSRDFALVFNTTSDSFQVINATNGAVVSDVLTFGGGASVANGRERARFAFMFVPGISNAIGSAVITDFGTRTTGGNTNTNRANIFGNAQFVLTGNTVLGATNISAAGTNIMGTNVVSGTSTNITGTNVISGTGTNFFLTAAFDDPTAEVCTATFFTGTRVQISTTTNVTPSASTTVSGTRTTTVTGAGGTGATATTSGTRTTTVMGGSGSSSAVDPPKK